MEKETPMFVINTGVSIDGRGRRTRTLKNGFGDRYVTITSCPYKSATNIV